MVGAVVDWCSVDVDAAKASLRAKPGAFKMTSRVQSFTIKAVDDTGQQHTLHIHQMYQTAPGSGPPVEAMLQGRITLANGEPVMHTGKGHYQTVNGLNLRSDDPKAP